MDSTVSGWVILSAEGTPDGLVAYWVPILDRVCVEPRDTPCRSYRIGEFLEVHLDAYSEKIVGFKLLIFSYMIEQVYELLRLKPHDKIRLDAVLLFYKAACFGEKQALLNQLLCAAEPTPSEIPLMDVEEKIDELRKLVGEATIYQPGHARQLLR